MFIDRPEYGVILVRGIYKYFKRIQCISIRKTENKILHKKSYKLNILKTINFL